MNESHLKPSTGFLSHSKQFRFLTVVSRGPSLFAHDYVLEFLSRPLSLCCSHCGLFPSWTHQNHFQLWAFPATAFSMEMLFLLSYLITANSLPFISQHIHHFPRKTDTATPSETPPYLIPITLPWVTFFFALDITWYFLVYIYWFISPPLSHTIYALKRREQLPLTDCYVPSA